ncbi:MAG: carboxypeptidase regulatory-like domain-containing protein [Acidobacteriota bacterium]
MKRFSFAPGVFCLLTAALLLVSAPAAAQVVTGEIQGTITDASGSPLPGVTVTVKNQDTGIGRTVITNASGAYNAKALRPGVYEVVASLEGLQTIRQENIQILTRQVKDINLQMQVESTTEVITVTAETPLIEVSRTSAANYVDEVAIDNLPINGRDFTTFATLTPTVLVDRSRGFLTMSGQRGIYTDLNVDGANNKSTFFGYGRGGEATENDGLIIAQDSVQEFKIVVNEFSPEFGRSGGGSINVVTKSGTNAFQGSVFAQYRDDAGAADLPSSPLDDFRGVDGSAPVDEFERLDWGLSLGGPIKQDKTHFFLAGDFVGRDEPFSRTISVETDWDGCGASGSLNCLSAYDAILLRAQNEPDFAALVDGFERRADGTAQGNFVRSVDNTILFGKIDQQFTDTQQASLRLNFTDYERTSGFLDEESLKVEETLSAIGSWTSIIGANAVNEFRFQYATDDLDRLSQRVGQPIEAQVRFLLPGVFASVGKFDFLPIFVEETQTQLRNDFSYLFGAHDMKFGVDYSDDDLKQLFAGSRDGRYDFFSVEDFLNNDAGRARIYFGNVQFPNYDEAQESLGIYAQDTWKTGDLTLNYGIRYEAEYNPDNLDHVFGDGRSIPDDTDNIGPRVGLAWSPNGTDVFRAGAGLFFGRTATLLFASQIQENGIFPNFGRITVSPGQTGFVPLGQQIPNQNPPAATVPSSSFVDPDWELAETVRVNVGYERTLSSDWTAKVDAIYAEGDNLQRNVDINRQIERYDEFGRPIYADARPGAAALGLEDTIINQILVRRSIGNSEYKALTFAVRKRYSNGFSLDAHYTWSEDEDDDSNERSATGVTITDITNPGYDWGLSDRNVENRFVVTAVYELPWEIKVSGVFEYRDGTPFSAQEQSVDVHNYPFGNGFFGDDALAVINGQLTQRNQFTNEDVTTVDLRFSKFFTFGENYQADFYLQAFNLFDENAFTVGGSQTDPTLSSGAVNPEFGIPNNLLTQQRQIEYGVRLSF